MGKEHRKSDKNSPKYIVRFDDLCPEMNWNSWHKIEEILYKYDVKPIIAVVPNNEDQYLKCQTPIFDFWAHIRKYQADGFMIALHGYNHVYTNHKAGIMGISANSEFCGLTQFEQEKKINDGLSIFELNGVRADCFIAPSHSFDKNTLRALRGKISVISDGHSRYPYTSEGFLYIPCQQWDVFTEEKKAGIYTVCIHSNNWNEENIERFEQDVKKYAEYIIQPFSIADVKPITIFTKIRNSFIAWKFRVKRFVKRVLRRG